MLELRNVEKRFSPSCWGVRNIDLSIGQGEAVAMLGASGSGKTTLLDIIGTLSRPTGGIYTINGASATQLGDRAISRLRQKMFGYIFQSFNLMNDWTVRNNLRLALNHQRHKPSDAELQNAMDGIGLHDKLNARVNTLSGGEQQRVAVLRTVLRNPQVVLADEPTGNLDPVNVDVVMDMLLSLWYAGKTVIMITHSAELAERFPRIVRLERGQILEDRLASSSRAGS